MKVFFDQMKTLWGRLETPQRATIVLIGVGFVIACSLLLFSASRMDYRVLVRDMGRADVHEIVAYLEDKGVKYRIVDNETAILVPNNVFYSLRSELAQQDLLGDHSTGFELLDQGSFSDSTFKEQKNYDRAVAGELERIFREYPRVKSARVIVVRPQPSPFIADDEHRASASVFLDMEEGSRISEQQLQGIVRLTARSVEGLDTDRVEIADNKGLLTQDESDEGALRVSTAMEAERAREVSLTERAQAMLNRILGPGRSMVTISVDLDFTERTEASRTPTEKVVVNEQTITTDESTPIPETGGVAGTFANLEEGVAPAPQSIENATKTSEDATKQYTVGENHVTTRNEVGIIQGMTVSILLDHKETMVADVDAEGAPVLDEEGNPVMKKELVEYSEAERQQIQELVLDAIGFKSARDIQAAKTPGAADERFSVTVQSMKLHREEVSNEVLSASILPLDENIQELIKYGMMAIVALGFLLVARGQLKRSQAVWEQQEVERKAKADEQERLSKEAAESPEALMEQRLETREAIRQAILDNPDTAAQVLKRWMYNG